MPNLAKKELLGSGKLPGREVTRTALVLAKFSHLVLSAGIFVLVNLWCCTPGIFSGILTEENSQGTSIEQRFVGSTETGKEKHK